MEATAKTTYWPLTQQRTHSETAWRPGLRYIPWIAGLSLAALAACVVAAIVIIVVSDNQPVASWKLEPAVLLAVVSSLANAAMGLALTQGAAIAWWRGALQGATLKELHYIWSWGRGSFRPTLKPSSRIFKMAFVAVIVSLVTIVTNPLLQRASRVRSGSATSAFPLSMDLMENPLAQPYGLSQSGVPADTFMFTNFLLSVQDWYNKTAIMTQNVTGYECDGTCVGSLTVPGLTSNCHTQTAELSLGNTLNEGDAIFSINFTRTKNAEGNTILGLDVLYAATVSDMCVASMVIEHCDISTALVQQEIKIENGSITLADSPSQLISVYNSPLDLVNAPDGTRAGPLAILNWLGVFYFESSFTLNYDITNEVAADAHGIVPTGQQYQIVNSTSTLACQFTFTSPVNDIIRAMEEVLFRMAYAPRGLPGQYPMATQTFPVTQATPALVFESNYKYAGIAVAIMVIALLVLLLPLWGWWQLGRSVSLSPLETGKAFGAPLMHEATAANDASDLIDEIGDVRVRYGEVVGVRQSTGMMVSRLEIGLHDSVQQPHKGDKFGQLGPAETVYHMQK